MDPSSKDLVEFLRGVEKKYLEPLYRRHNVNLRAGVEKLVKEIELDAANSILSMFRGWKGQNYGDIVRELAVRLGAEVTETSSIEELEVACLEHSLGRYLHSLDHETSRRLVANLNTVKRIPGEIGRQLQEMTLQPQFLQRWLGELGRNETVTLIRGLTLPHLDLPAWSDRLRDKASDKLEAFGSMISQALAPLLSLDFFDLAGPGYRRILPTVLDIALLRLKFGQRDQANPLRKVRRPSKPEPALDPPASPPMSGRNKKKTPGQVQGQRSKTKQRKSTGRARTTSKQNTPIT
ncbi:MAG: hypothetical protein A2284_15825 [Deltaproteobacteria bacterium RIFOXYA12_FULL_61_11]|nr:MAG: hypothetical protein A2284_15825 [Deltaproteobacteria bacterium RIFOXYA12_FULL_61_11]